MVRRSAAQPREERVSPAAEPRAPRRQLLAPPPATMILAYVAACGTCGGMCRAKLVIFSYTSVTCHGWHTLATWRPILAFFQIVYYVT